MAGSCLTWALAALGWSFFPPLGLSFHISNSDTWLQPEIQVPRKLGSSRPVHGEAERGKRSCRYGPPSSSPLLPVWPALSPRESLSKSIFFRRRRCLWWELGRGVEGNGSGMAGGRACTQRRSALPCRSPVQTDRQTDSRSQLPGPHWNRRWESACSAGPRTEGSLVLEPDLEVVFLVGD